MEECLIVFARYAAYWIRVSSLVGKWVDLCGLWNAQNSTNQCAMLDGRSYALGLGVSDGKLGP